MRDCYKNDNNGRKELGTFKYCECAMYKENIDTIQAVNLISKHLRVNHKRIGYAGTKDKKGKTTQLMSFFKWLYIYDYLKFAVIVNFVEN